MEKSTIENVREYKFDPKSVIEGLNGYYESEPRNGVIRVYRNDVDGPAYLGVNWLSALIEWLREDHDIFYYPGMNAAKMCGLRATIQKLRKDLEDARNETRKAVNEQVKKDQLYTCEAFCDILEALGISKSDTVHLDIPGLKTKAIQRASVIKVEHDTEIENLKADLKKAKMEKEKFLIEVADREDEIESLQKKGANLYLEHRRYIVNNIMNNIRQEASRNGFKLPEKVDGEPLTIERTFHDLLEFLRMKGTNKAEEELKKLKEQNQERDTEIKNLKERIEELESDFKAVCDEDDIFRTRALKAEEELKKLKTGQKSDINKLIRDYCAKNNIIAPSRYLSDEACVEYLFSYGSKDVAKRAYENMLFYLISYWERLGYDRHDILFEGVSNPSLTPSLTLTIENLINKYAEKDRQAQTCDVELKRARDTIDTLRCLMDNVNTELENY